MSKAVSLSVVPADVQSTNTGLAAIHLFVDGVEEPLSADRGKIKVPLKPGTQTVSVRAVASERHATLLIYRLDTASSQPATV